MGTYLGRHTATLNHQVKKPIVLLTVSMWRYTNRVLRVSRRRCPSTPEHHTVLARTIKTLPRHHPAPKNTVLCLTRLGARVGAFRRTLSHCPVEAQSALPSHPPPLNLSPTTFNSTVYCNRQELSGPSQPCCFCVDSSTIAETQYTCDSTSTTYACHHTLLYCTKQVPDQARPTADRWPPTTGHGPHDWSASQASRVSHMHCCSLYTSTRRDATVYCPGTQSTTCSRTSEHVAHAEGAPSPWRPRSPQSKIHAEVRRPRLPASTGARQHTHHTQPQLTTVYLKRIVAAQRSAAISQQETTPPHIPPDDGNSFPGEKTNTKRSSLPEGQAQNRGRKPLSQQTNAKPSQAQPQYSKCVCKRVHEGKERDRKLRPRASAQLHWLVLISTWQPLWGHGACASRRATFLPARPRRKRNSKSTHRPTHSRRWEIRARPAEIWAREHGSPCPGGGLGRLAPRSKRRAPSVQTSQLGYFRA